MVAVVVLVLVIILCVCSTVVYGIETCSSEYGVAKSIQKEMLVERLL